LPEQNQWEDRHDDDDIHGTRCPYGGGLCAGAVHDTIRFWTTEEQPERLARQEAMAADFTAETGIEVEVIPVTESDLGTRATAAFAAGDLPDVIYHTLQYALPWYEAGILDADAATEVIENLGADTFAPGALAMAAVDEGYASVPVDGWTQMIVYRADLFEEAGLEPPNLRQRAGRGRGAAQPAGDVRFRGRDQGRRELHVPGAGACVPRQWRLAGGPGRVPAARRGPTVEVLEFYKAIAEASPEGELFWQQSRELYFAGQAAMIIWSPFILDELAGLRDSAPPTINDDPTSRDLAERTGIVTNFAGPVEPRWRGLGRYPLFRRSRRMRIPRRRRPSSSISMSDGYTADAGHRARGQVPGAPG
jgi:multiple sugar transport system substrate-binding protein